MMVDKDLFELPKVTKLNLDDAESYHQLNAFYNYVIKREDKIKKWRDDSKRFLAILNHETPCNVCPERTRPLDVTPGCLHRAGCGFLWVQGQEG